MAHAQKPDFVFRRNGRVHLNRRGSSVQSTTGSRCLRIGGSNAGYTMFRGSVKSTGYPPHSPVSPSLPRPCVTVCHHVSTGLYLPRRLACHLTRNIPSSLYICLELTWQDWPSIFKLYFRNVVYFRLMTLNFLSSSHRTFWYSHSSFTNRCTFIKTLITIYIKVRWLLHVSVYDHHQGACNWAWLKLYWYENIQ